MLCISSLPRFGMLLMFLSDADKATLARMCDMFDATANSPKTRNDALTLRGKLAG